MHSYGPTRGRDLIARALRREVDVFKKCAFDTFDLDIKIFPASNAAEAFNESGKWLGFDRYTFDLFGGTDKTMKVDVDNNGKPRIRYLGGWHHVSRFLQELARAKITTTWEQEGNNDFIAESRRKDWNRQWAWWSRNGRKFRFLDLPTEIRELIYVFALGQRVEPYPRSRHRRIGSALSKDLILKNPDTSVFLLNRQVHAEATEIFFQQATFSTIVRGLLGQVVRNIFLSSRITRLELALSHEEFLRLFHSHRRLTAPSRFQRRNNIRHSVRFNNMATASALRQMRLHELIVDIDAPSRVNHANWVDVACQKVVVDWVLEAAVRWVKGHMVRVTGYAKTKQREAFEANCAEERQEYLAWCRLNLGREDGEGGTLQEYDEWVEDDGGVSLEEESEVEGGDNIEDGDEVEDAETDESLFPPPCRCKVKCEFNTWTPDS